MKNILEIKNLSISFDEKEDGVKAIEGISLSLGQGEILALVGESGSGKSVLCKSILKLLPKSARVRQDVLKIKGIDIKDYGEKQMCQIRGKEVAMMFQDPMTSLNPTLSVGRQIEECLQIHYKDWDLSKRRQRVLELMQLVGIPDAEKRYDCMPWQFSGGMRQRCVLAIALAGEPEILIADEPTTALDVTVQAQMIKLLREIQSKMGTSMIFVTHDLGVAAGIADRILVMKEGKVVEEGTTEDIFYHPKEAYTQQLISSHPAIISKKQKSIHGAEKSPVLAEVSHLSHYFKLGNHSYVKAVQDVSFTIREGEIFSLVGESGSGKSTVARCIMGINQPMEGNIVYDGILCNGKKTRADRKRLEKERQIIFQDSGSALNQKMKLKKIIEEPIRIQHTIKNKKEREEYIRQELQYVGMEEEYLSRYPSQISGGQRQRVAIARAFGMKPRLLVADEPLASLDVTTQVQIVHLFKHLVEEHYTAMLLIAHDLSMVRSVSTRVGVMYHGRLVELAETEELFQNPLHPYTKALLSAVPLPDPKKERDKEIIVYQEERRKTENLVFKEEKPGHFVLREAGE